jgi:hypothetical protein
VVVVRGRRSKGVPVAVSRKSVQNKGEMEAMSSFNKAKLWIVEKNLDKGLDKGNEFASLDYFS